MKTNCNIIQDLIPLYIDQALSEESVSLVEEHLRECPLCNEILESMKSNFEIPENIDDRKVIKQFTVKIKKGTFGYVITIVLFILFWVWKYLNKYHNLYLDMNVNNPTSIILFSDDQWFELICMLMPWIFGFIIFGLLYFGFKFKEVKKHLGKIILLSCMIMFTNYRNEIDFSYREQKSEYVIEKIKDNKIFFGKENDGSYMYEIKISKAMSKLMKTGINYQMYFMYNNDGEGYLISAREKE